VHPTIRVFEVACLLLLSALLLSALLLSGPALAQQPNPSPAEKDHARERYLAGNEAYRAGNYEAALKAFDEADRIMGVPTTGLGLAKSQAKTGKLVEAFATLERVLRFPERSDEPSSFTEARRQARALLPELTERIPTITVQVSGVDSGASVTVSVDSSPLPQPDAATKVNPGSHAVTASAPGYSDGQASVTVGEGERRVVSLVLVHGDSPPPPPESGDNTAATALMVTGFSVGAVALVAAAITGALSLNTTSSLDDECGGNVCPESSRKDHERAIAFANGSNASFAIAGVGLVVGIVGLVMYATADGDEAAMLTPRGLEVRF
jgi:hypothetical protein